jgi:cytochrome b6
MHEFRARWRLAARPGHGMVIVELLHMRRVFCAGSYRPPREFNWFIGAILLFLSFTG